MNLKTISKIQKYNFKIKRSGDSQSSGQESKDTKENFDISYKDRNLRSHPADLSGIIQRNSLGFPQISSDLSIFGLL